MAEIGAFLSSEEHGPAALVAQAQMAEAAGFASVLISDHFHPWTTAQGESSFVWGVIGAIGASTRQRITTGVTCPTVRIHPAIVAQAAATAQLLTEGRFRLGVGSGEALNEHIFGDRWPPVAVRHEMLEEATGLIRRLWTGRSVTHRGRYYTVERARLFSCPATPPPILVSAFGPRSTALAARIGDGLVAVTPAQETLDGFRSGGGQGPAIGSVKVCWDPSEAQARKTAHHLWAVDLLPGQLNQDLPTPTHFAQATGLVTEEMVAGQIACGPDPERHAAAVRAYLEAGFDEVYVNQIGAEQAGFFRFWRHEVAPRLGV